MIFKIYDKQREERAFVLYASIYPHYNKETFIQFEEFYKPQKIEEVMEDKTPVEILSDVKEILNSHSWR